MILTIKPSDIIERCIWTEYSKFCLKNLNAEEIDNIISEDKSVTICEEDAYVIGLLKIIQTDNLVHRFKLHMLDFLKNRSSIIDGQVIINKSSFMKECITFEYRFPKSYKNRSKFEFAIGELIVFIKQLVTSLEALGEIKIAKKQGNVNKVFTYLESKQVEKLIKI